MRCAAGRAGSRQAGGGGGGGGPQYFPSSPLKYIRAKAPGAKVEYNDGTDPAAAAALAKASQVAIVFVNQPMSEGRDAATLTLPDNQDDLVSAVPRPIRTPSWWPRPAARWRCRGPVR